MTNTERITKFYASFANGDAEGMLSYYHDNIRFHDPAFGTLVGDDAKNMWRMLLHRNKGGIAITFRDVNADEQSGSANWRAEYVFSQTGRKVINTIAAQFEFQDGKIIAHTDNFDLWKWTRQALGWKGYLLGWSGFMQKKIQHQTTSLLKSYIGKQQLP